MRSAFLGMDVEPARAEASRLNRDRDSNRGADADLLHGCRDDAGGVIALYLSGPPCPQHARRYVREQRTPSPPGSPIKDHTIQAAFNPNMGDPRSALA